MSSGNRYVMNALKMSLILLAGSLAITVLRGYPGLPFFSLLHHPHHSVPQAEGTTLPCVRMGKQGQRTYLSL